MHLPAGYQARKSAKLSNTARLKRVEDLTLAVIRCAVLSTNSILVHRCMFAGRRNFRRSARKQREAYRLWIRRHGLSAPRSSPGMQCLEFIKRPRLSPNHRRPRCTDHEIVPLTRKPGAHISSDVVGPICESSDYFCKDRPLPKVGGGDYLALLSAGAYGFAQASNYNTRPLAAEILVHGRRAAAARGRQPMKEIWSGEKVVAWSR